MDPFVKKFKKNNGLLRKIHYQERIKLKNTKPLLPIYNKFSDWRSEVVRCYNKWTEEPNKQLFINGDSQVILTLILKLMGNFNKVITFLYKYLIYFNKNRISSKARLL